MSVLPRYSIQRNAFDAASTRHGGHVFETVIVLISLVLAALCLSQTVLAAGPDASHGPGQHDMQPESLTGGGQQTPDLSPNQAADRARDKYGGRVLNVLLEHGPSGPYYRVKLLDSGRVRVVHIKAD